MRRAIPVFILLLCAAPLWAAELTVDHAWIRLLPGNLPLAGYVNLHNAGKHTVVLESAGSPVFDSVQFHHSMAQGGMESMQPVANVDIAPGTTFRFAPGGYHLMLMGRKRALKPGDAVPITFRYQDGSVQTISFIVKGADGP